MLVRKWKLAHLAEDAAHVVSELMTNAVTAATQAFGPAPLTFRLRSDSTSLLITVRDPVVAWPWPRGAWQGEAERGRGLAIVAALSREWGFYPDGHGKVVWALL
jgi:hypothetical protein